MSQCEVTEEDLKALHRFVTSVEYKEDKMKDSSKKKDKTKKHKKECKAKGMGSNSFEDISCFLRDISNRTTDISSKKKHKKVKKNKHDYDHQDVLQKKKVDKLEAYQSQECSLTPFSLPGTSKKNRHFLGGCTMANVNDGNLTEVKRRKEWRHTKSPQGINNIRAEQKVVYKFLCFPSSQANPLNDELKQHADVCSQDAPWVQTPHRKKVAFDSSAHHLGHGRASNTNRSSSFPKGFAGYDSRIGYSASDSRPSSTEPLLSSSPTPIIELNTYDSEDEFSMQQMKDKKSFHAVKTKPEEIKDDVCNSQDLFITQKSFLPLSGSSGESVCSSSQKLKSSGCVASEEPYKRNRSADAVHVHLLSSSHIPEYNEYCPPAGSAYDCRLHFSRKKAGSVQDTATQTEDFFSSSSPVTSLHFSRRSDEFSEPPLDLSLPTRMRANTTSHRRACCSMFGEGDGIHVSPALALVHVSHNANQSASPAVQNTVSDDEKPLNVHKYPFTECRKSEEGKYVQTLLNESYFFKVKGELKPKAHREPLVKHKTGTGKRRSAEDKREAPKCSSRPRQQ